MTMKESIDADLKAAMLAGDKFRSTVLRGLKSSILNAEIESGSREAGLSDEAVISVLQKEAKKRQESADVYSSGGNDERASAELAEKELISKYLPQQLPDSEVAAAIDKAIQDTGAGGLQSMGQVIGIVKQKLGPRADGAVIARLAKEKLS